MLHWLVGKRLLLGSLSLFSTFNDVKAHYLRSQDDEASFGHQHGCRNRGRQICFYASLDRFDDSQVSRRDKLSVWKPSFRIAAHRADSISEVTMLLDPHSTPSLLTWKRPAIETRETSLTALSNTHTKRKILSLSGLPSAQNTQNNSTTT